MKRIYINGVDTELKARNAEDAVYGVAEHLLERMDIEAINDAHDDAIYIEAHPWPELEKRSKKTRGAK